MIKLKKNLIIFLCVHVLCVFFVNIYAFKKITKTKSGKLNPVGKYFFEDLNINKPGKLIEYPIGVYTSLIGANRGYEFFSPNVRNGSVELFFTSENGVNINLLKSFEGNAKEITFKYNFNLLLKNSKKRNELVELISKRIFSLNSKINEISVYIVIREYNNLSKINNKISNKERRILISEIQRDVN